MPVSALSQTSVTTIDPSPASVSAISSTVSASYRYPHEPLSAWAVIVNVLVVESCAFTDVLKDFQCPVLVLEFAVLRLDHDRQVIVDEFGGAIEPIGYVFVE